MNKTKINPQNNLLKIHGKFLLGVLFLILLGACNSIRLDNNRISQGQLPTSNLPDVARMTIKGVVSADGKGLEGVVVSDGYEVTTTKKNGAYYLPSRKKNGYVFISVPGNYEVSNKNSLPQFFKRLSGGKSVEQRDFSLTKTDNNKHIILGMADWHLANQNNDLKQYSNKFAPDVNATIAEYKVKGVKVYGLALGDMSWDYYWYRNNFGLQEYLAQMNKIDCPIFNVIGNHDHDPYVQGDWESATRFRTTVGPNYYSFNLGKAHYVVLDNIEYINTSGKQGVMGKRDNNSLIVKEQMEWLKKDLATIHNKNAPLVIAMHVPLFNAPTLDEDGNEKTSTTRLENGAELITLLKEFTNVHVLSGHTHVNFTTEPSSTLIEHTTASVCGTSWWTGKDGFAENHICYDGSPGGYGVWEIDGDNIQWYYKSMGYDKDYQFRTYDMNTVHITADQFAPYSNNSDISKYVGNYAKPNNNNEVLINVWNYEPNWDVVVREDGEPLDVKRIIGKDPLHFISLAVKQLDKGSKNVSSLVARNSAHFFKVKAKSATSTLEIKVTDRFGNTYEESMVRPKEFTYLMR